jgi:uncharacterized membrane protein YkoI
MRKRTTTIITISAIVAGAALATGAGFAVAGGTANDTEQPISGDALGKASDAALAHTGEGRVSETEVGDEESYYEVEVTLDDGSEVDVQLDRDFQVVSSETDGADDGAGRDD